MWYLLFLYGNESWQFPHRWREDAVKECLSPKNVENAMDRAFNKWGCFKKKLHGIYNNKEVVENSGAQWGRKAWRN